MYDDYDDQEQPRDAQSDPSSHPSFPSAIQTTMKEVSGNRSMDRGSSSVSLSVAQAQYWLGTTSVSAIETIVMYE